MAKQSDYSYAVIECDLDGAVNKDVSHYVFKTITKANEFREKLQAENPELCFIILHLYNR